MFNCRGGKKGEGNAGRLIQAEDEILSSWTEEEIEIYLKADGAVSSGISRENRRISGGEKMIQLSDSFNYRKLLQFTFPSIVMMIFTSIYGVVDGFFVSNFAEKHGFLLQLTLSCRCFLFWGA